MPLSDAEKMNKVVRIIHQILVEMGWGAYWGTVCNFLMGNQGKVLRLYDVIVEVVESGRDS